MAKAGAYSALVTTQAPASGAVTSKARGYQWLEYSAPAPVNPLQSRVLGWWEFEEPGIGSGRTLFDQVASYEMGTGNPYVSVGGVRGQAAQMLIDTGWLETNLVPQTFTLVDQVWSASFWHRTPDPIVADAYIACSWRNANVQDAITGRRKWRVKYNAAANGFIYSIGYGDGNDYIGDVDIDTGDIGIGIDEWYHFAITHDPVADQMTLTVSKRGDTVGTRISAAVVGGAFDGGATPVLNLPIYVARDTVGDQDCNGVLDMFAIWDTSAILSEADVQALFENEAIYSELST